MIFATGSTYSQGTPTPDWMAPVMGVVIGLAIIAGIVAAIVGIKAHIQGNDVRRSLGARQAQKAAQAFGGVFYTNVGAALSGSYEQVRDAHAPATHFLALEDHFEEHCQRKEVWVPLSYGPFASGKNRYLLNYVRIQRPYGSLAAYLFRYDDPVVDWHQAAVCDIFPGPDQSAQAQDLMARDHQILANTLQGMVGLRSLYTDEVVDSHQIMMMNDYMPTKVNDLYKALLSLG